LASQVNGERTSTASIGEAVILSVTSSEICPPEATITSLVEG
jgi:hypothetical protein